MNNNKYISIFLFLVFFSFTIIHPQIVDRRTPVVRVVEQVGPAIVNISTERIVKGHFTPDFDEFFDEFFGGYRHKIFKTKSLGSGVIVDRSGFIVTNEHVIQRASKITIILSDGRKFQAQVLGSNSQNDIALLKIDTTMSLTSIKWANSDDILIGETAIALGNPFGLKNSVTTGVLSATNRTLSIRGKKTFHDYIQTDAAINPGNSGGALLNILGELVGINTAIYAKGRGLGFAIPSKRVREVIGTLIDYEKDKKFHLGLEFEEDFAKNRVKVSAIHPKSPANNIKVGDIIVRINGQRVQSIFDLKKILYQKQAGDRIRLIVKSAGTRKRQVSITLKKEEQLPDIKLFGHVLVFSHMK